MILFSILLFCGAVAGVILYGEMSWRAGTRSLRGRLEAARLPLAIKSFDLRELEPLPPPVQRYFRAVLTGGQPLVVAATVEHIGTFNLSEAGEQWKPFTSTQRVITHRPGFHWDARIAMAPGISVFVRDGYVAGEGLLRASVAGLFTKVHLRDRGELARGELMRFFIEAAWYPTALLPSQGIEWSAVDDHSAHATLRDGDLTITLLFRFNAEGLIDTVRAEARGRTMGGKAVSMPWEGKLWGETLLARADQEPELRVRTLNETISAKPEVISALPAMNVATRSTNIMRGVLPLAGVRVNKTAGPPCPNSTFSTPLSPPPLSRSR